MKEFQFLSDGGSSRHCYRSAAMMADSRHSTRGRPHGSMSSKETSLAFKNFIKKFILLYYLVAYVLHNNGICGTMYNKRHV